MDKQPVVHVLNCFHVFTGIKWNQWHTYRRNSDPTSLLNYEVSIPLCGLDRRLLWQWYYQHSTNQFGYPLSEPFTLPYILYYPSPRQFLLRVFFNIVGSITAVIRALTGR